MKTRVITGVLGVALFLVVAFFHDTILFHIVIAAINALAVYEVFSATNQKKNWPLLAASLIMAVVIPFVAVRRSPYLLLAVGFAYTLFVFCTLLMNRGETSMEKTAVVYMMTIILPVAFSSFIMLRDAYKGSPFGLQISDGVFFIFLCGIGAWVSDTAAFFCGKFLGRHKMCPRVSPHKTVEGAVGGVVFCVLGFLAAGLIYDAFLAGSAHVNYAWLLPVGAACSALSVLGDLSASLIKRAYGVKDFGNIFPGHGGLLDRFDSIIFVGPFLFLMVQLVPIIIR